MLEWNICNNTCMLEWKGLCGWMRKNNCNSSPLNMQFGKRISSAKRNIKEQHYENDRILVFEIIEGRSVWILVQKFENLRWPICLLLYHFFALFAGFQSNFAIASCNNSNKKQENVNFKAGVTCQIICHNQQTSSSLEFKINAPLDLYSYMVLL